MIGSLPPAVIWLSTTNATETRQLYVVKELPGVQLIELMIEKSLEADPEIALNIAASAVNSYLSDLSEYYESEQE